MRIGTGLLAVVVAGALALATTAGAHDFWIEPSRFASGPGETVTLRLLVGERFHGEPLPRNDALLARFVLSGPSGETPVAGRDGIDPAGSVTPASPGLHVVGYRSRYSVIELEPGKFESYLAEEGLESISRLRAARGESGRGVRERFSRCARSLIAVGPTAEVARGHDAPLGLTLELVAEANPYALAAGDELPLRLTFDGAPLAGVLVSALAKGAPQATVAARTDAAGRVRLRLATAGEWLVKAVHMVALPPGEDAEWESTWASLTFELPARDARAR